MVRPHSRRDSKQNPVNDPTHKLKLGLSDCACHLMVNDITSHVLIERGDLFKEGQIHRNRYRYHRAKAGMPTGMEWGSRTDVPTHPRPARFQDGKCTC